MKYAPWLLSIVLAALLISLNQQNAALTEKYNKLVEGANNKQQQLAKEANQLIAVASLPEATVSISFRPEVLQTGNVFNPTKIGVGSVAVITNISDDNIPINVVIKRASTGQSKSYDFVMNARTVKQIGNQDGWAFVSGDVIAVNQPNHKVKTIALN